MDRPHSSLCMFLFLPFYFPSWFEEAMFCPNPACPAVWLSPVPAMKEYFVVINMLMNGEELTTEAADHCSLVMVQGKRIKSYLLGARVRNGVL